jgi:hypothetical protein
VGPCLHFCPPPGRRVLGLGGGVGGQNGVCLFRFR